jgi:hypothetical protein
MALSISSAAPATMIFSNSQFNRFRVVTIKCESKEPPPPETGLRLPAKSSKLEIGSPVILIEAPKMIKTAASVPCLRVNSGLVNPGDVGRYSESSYLSISIPCTLQSKLAIDFFSLYVLIDGLIFKVTLIVKLHDNCTTVL